MRGGAVDTGGVEGRADCLLAPKSMLLGCHLMRQQAPLCSAGVRQGCSGSCFLSSPRLLGCLPASTGL